MGESWDTKRRRMTPRGGEPRPFNYLSEGDFESLTIDLSALLTECVGGPGAFAAVNP